MKKMPEDLKKKLRKLHKLNCEARELDNQIKVIFETYGVNSDNLCAEGHGEVQTEALAFISYAEGDVEENIAEIEEVFLHYVNSKSK